MPMPMVHIWKMVVRMRQGKMDMPVGMKFANWTMLIMGMLMMGAVAVGVFMRHFLMHMVMFVALSQVQPNPPKHEGRAGQ